MNDQHIVLWLDPTRNPKLKSVLRIPINNHPPTLLIHRLLLKNRRARLHRLPMLVHRQRPTPLLPERRERQPRQR